MRTKGFTLVELLVSLAVLGVLLALSVAAIGNSRGPSELANQAEEIASQLRFAQNKTLASEGSAQYGVYFNNGTTPHQYEVFQGSAYPGTVETVYRLADEVEFDTIAFADLSGQEAVFQKVSGATSNPGDVTVRLKDDPSQTEVVYVESSGKVEVGNSAAASDAGRVTDTRHVHIDYHGRPIDVSVATSETLTLDFVGFATTQNILLSDYISGGQIDWEGAITVAGDDQTLKIHTHMLNSGGASDETQFSIHRDARFNDKPLLITLSGDGACVAPGKIVEYDAAGVRQTGGESSCVVATNEQ